MKDRKKLEKTVKDLQTAITKAQKDLKELDVTYSTGDRFRHTSGEKYILVCPDYENVALISLRDGNRHRNSATVNTPQYVTPEEFLKICRPCEFSRYWDFQKGEQV